VGRRIFGTIGEGTGRRLEKTALMRSFITYTLYQILLGLSNR
jgi:hypothetical protein